MGIEVFENFNLAANKRLRYGWTVADQTARLNLKWVADGLLVKQKDDGNWYECIVDAATNSSAPFTSVEDWKLFEGKPGDNAYLYIAYADDDQGTGFSTSDASKDYIAFLSTDEEIETPSAGDFAGLWYDRSGLEAPELQVQYSADGVNNWGSTPNAYIRVSTDGGDTWGDAYQIKGADGESGDRYKTTSTTSNDITGSGQLTFTVDTDLAWTPGQTTKIVQTSNASNYIEATVDSYNGTTGEFVVTATGSGGTGTGVTDWSINLAGVSGGDGKSVEINYSVDGSTNWHGTLNASQDKYIRFRLEGGSWSSGARFMGNDGATGKAGVITANDITLTEALVTTVQGGSYTPQNPYIASVATDNRSNKFSPSAISGDMAGRAIAYDGTNWYNQGRWLGFPGAAANISSVSATSVDSSQNASVVLGGTQQNRTFQFNIPRGVPGTNGSTGPGYNSITDLGLVTGGRNVRFEGVNGASDKTILVPQGPQGPQGEPGTFAGFEFHRVHNPGGNPQPPGWTITVKVPDSGNHIYDVDRGVIVEMPDNPYDGQIILLSSRSFNMSNNENARLMHPSGFSRIWYNSRFVDSVEIGYGSVTLLCSIPPSNPDYWFVMGSSVPGERYVIKRAVGSNYTISPPFAYKDIYYIHYGSSAQLDLNLPFVSSLLDGSIITVANKMEFGIIRVLTQGADAIYGNINQIAVQPNETKRFLVDKPGSRYFTI